MSKVKTVTVPLEEPILYQGKQIVDLTFRRMKAKDALVAEEERNSMRAGYRLFAALSGVDVELIEELDVDDLETIAEKTAPLLGKSAAALALRLSTEEKASSGVTSSRH